MLGTWWGHGERRSSSRGVAASGQATYSTLLSRGVATHLGMSLCYWGMARTRDVAPTVNARMMVTLDR